VSLSLSAGGVQKIAFADTATTTFPNYAIIVVDDMGAMEVMSESINKGSQQTAKFHNTETFPNHTIFTPVYSIGNMSSRKASEPNQGFSPWVQTTPY
jgi:hypothetical protein